MTIQRTPPAPAAQRRPPSTAWHRRAVSLALALLVLLLVVASVRSLRPPEPKPTTAAAAEFSAARALTRMDHIAAAPHPTGSAKAAEVRDYLVRELRGLDTRPTVQTRTASRLPPGGYPTIARVHNVYAHLPGSKPTGRVLLVAHHDSVPNGPGASDNGSNVAAILEIVRALHAQPRLRNDVDVLFTDAEEPGLLGAQAFTASQAGDPHKTVVVNMDTRGVSGPALMYQMKGGLTAAFAHSDVVTTSFADTVYALLPNDTDFTVLTGAGMRGINLAFMDGAAPYHTARDDLAHINAGSVQHMGDAALSAVRSLGTADLGEDAPKGTYFSLFGTVISYPGWLTLPLAIAALAALVLVLVRGRRHGLRLTHVGLAAGSFTAVLATAAGVGFGGWWLLSALQPAAALGIGGVYHPTPYVLAGAVLMATVLLCWYLWARRRFTAAAATTGVLGWFAVLAVVCAVLLPGGAYLFTLPALLGLGALAATLHAEPRSPLHVLPAAAAAIPATVLLVPVSLLVTTAVGLSLGAAPLLLLTLFAATALPLLEPAPSRRVSLAFGAVLVAGAVATAAVAAHVNTYDDGSPRPVSLAYAWESDTGTASWLSRGGPEQPGVGRRLTAGPDDFGDRIPSLAGASLYHGQAAEPRELPAPSIARTAPDHTDPDTGQRTVRLRLAVPDGATLVDVFADTSRHDVYGATVDGVPIDARDAVLTAPWGWGFRYAAPPGKGIDIAVRTKDSGPLRLRAISTVPGLPKGVHAPTLPSDTVWAGLSELSGQTMAVRTFTF